MKDKIPETAIALIEQLLQKNQGVFIGEQHNLLSPKDWLITNIPALRKAGVTHFYTEFVDAKDQWLVDEFQKHNPRAELLLQQLIIHTNQDMGLGVGAAYYEVLKTARDSGMEVRGIDNMHFADIYNKRHPDNPVAIMNDGLRLDPSGVELRDFYRLRERVANHDWKHTIKHHNKEHLQEEEKYVIYAGSGHSFHRNFFGLERKDAEQLKLAYSRQDPKGIDQLLHIPSVDFSERKIIFFNEWVEKEKSESDYVVYLPESKNQRYMWQTVAEHYNAPMQEMDVVKEMEKFKVELTLRSIQQSTEMQDAIHGLKPDSLPPLPLPEPTMSVQKPPRHL